MSYENLGRLDGFTFSPEDPLGIHGDPQLVFEPFTGVRVQSTVK